VGKVLRWGTLVFLCTFGFGSGGQAQSAKTLSAPKPSTTAETEALKREFIALLRDGNAEKFLAHVPAEGVNVGSEPRHATREEVEQEMQHRRGLYCKLFDTSCLEAPIKLDASARTCSFREALNESKNPRIAATETVRNGVHQAILVAQPNAGQCPGNKLIDFIFNYEDGGWKLFSLP
jgi:hypothetical protein